MHFVTVKGILSNKNGMNLYRGCLHGCIYCDARSHCYHMDHDFEDVQVKENAIPLLRQALQRKRKRCMIGMGAMSDPYLPLERTLCHTRQALQLLEAYGFGATLLTKSADVLRDLDLFEKIHWNSKCVVQMTLTTFEESLCRKVEPHVSTTRERLQALNVLQKAGIPTVVWLCPILPFINDTQENIQNLVDACAQAGVKGILSFGMGLTLREGNREYFYQQLDGLFPGLKQEYIRRYANAYQLESSYSQDLMKLFHHRCAAVGMLHDNEEIFQYLQAFQDTPRGQLSFFSPAP